MTTVKLKKVIDPIRHARLLQGIEGFAETAGIPEGFIHKSAREHLTEKEITWMKNYRQHRENNEGLLLLGVHDPDPATKMQAMTAGFLRNFIDARLRSVNNVVELLETPKELDCEVLLIPNLYQKAYGKTFPAHKIQAVYDLLMARNARGLVSVVYVQELDALEAEWGVLFAAHLKSYTVSKGKLA